MEVDSASVRNVTHYVEISLCSVTLLFNISLIVIILTTRSRVLHGYKYLLLLFAICELGFSTTHMLMEPILLVIRNDVVFFGYGIVGAHPMGPALLILWINFLSQIVICLTLHFIYRYVVLVKTKYTHVFREWRYLLPIMLLYIGFAATLAVVPLLYSTPDEMLIQRIEDRLASMGLTPEIISIIGAPISFQTSSGRSFNVFFLGLVILALSVNICAIFTILYCGYKINKYLTNATISERTRRQQNQLFKALLVQTAVPMVCIFIPATVFALGTVCEVDLGVGYFPIFTLFVVFPVLDPLIIAYFIGDYRRRILRIISRLCRIFDSSPKSTFTPINDNEEPPENGFEKDYREYPL